MTNYKKPKRRKRKRKRSKLSKTTERKRIAMFSPVIN